MFEVVDDYDIIHTFGSIDMIMNARFLGSFGLDH